MSNAFSESTITVNPKELIGKVETFRKKIEVLKENVLKAYFSNAGADFEDHKKLIVETESKYYTGADWPYSRTEKQDAAFKEDIRAQMPYDYWLAVDAFLSRANSAVSFFEIDVRYLKLAAIYATAITVTVKDIQTFESKFKYDNLEMLMDDMKKFQKEKGV